MIGAPASFLLRQEHLGQQVERLVDLALLVRILGPKAPHERQSEVLEVSELASPLHAGPAIGLTVGPGAVRVLGHVDSFAHGEGVALRSPLRGSRRSRDRTRLPSPSTIRTQEDDGDSNGILDH